MHPELWSRCAELSAANLQEDPTTSPSPPLRLPRHVARRYVTCRLAATSHYLSANRRALMPPPPPSNRHKATPPRHTLPHVPRPLASIKYFILPGALCDSRAAWVKQVALLWSATLRRREATAPSPSSKHLAPGTSRIAPHAAMCRRRLPPKTAAPHLFSARITPHLFSARVTPHRSWISLSLCIPLVPRAPPRTAHQSPRAVHPTAPSSQRKRKNCAMLMRESPSCRTKLNRLFRSYAVRWWVDHAKREVSVADDGAGKEDRESFPSD
ncbi:hypothetical protein GGX14DRAFT_634002 [Mycena pura]|uniref:Uncharacterized protein n=1 Tax=Mycena pura TaxID=153505 RepID=A0AAD6VFK4_9AGAR|nr:hypothetical protein GGX14DRAFT_634002 [Mycena pura]